MRLAVQQLVSAPDYLLIDGLDTIDWPCPQQAVIHGDAISLSIAAASVLAKVHRDRLLVELDRQFPGYGLASHKGYCSPSTLPPWPVSALPRSTARASTLSPKPSYN
jgi:ribonuclease HII